MAKKQMNKTASGGGSGFNIRIKLVYRREVFEVPTPVNFVSMVNAAGALVRKVTGEHPPLVITFGRTLITKPADFDFEMEKLEENDQITMQVSIDKQNPKVNLSDDYLDGEVKSFTATDLDDDVGTLRGFDDNNSMYGEKTRIMNQDPFMQPVRLTPYAEAGFESTVQKVSVKQVQRPQAPLPPIPPRSDIAVPRDTGSETELLLSPMTKRPANAKMNTETSDSTESQSGLQFLVQNPACINAIAETLASPRLQPVLKQIGDAVAKVMVDNAPVIFEELMGAIKNTPGLGRVFPEPFMDQIASLMAEAAQQEAQRKARDSVSVNASKSSETLPSISNYQPIPPSESASARPMQERDTARRLSPSQSRSANSAISQVDFPAKPSSNDDVKSRGSRNSGRASPIHSHLGYTSVPAYDDERSNKTGIANRSSPRLTLSAKRSGYEVLSDDGFIPKTSSDYAAQFIPTSNSRDSSMNRELGSSSRYVAYDLKAALDPKSIREVVLTLGTPEVVRWRIRNTGITKWPSDVVLALERGDIDFKPIPLNGNSVSPGESVSVELPVRANKFIPHQRLTFRLYDQMRKVSFGNEMNLDVFLQEGLPSPVRGVEPSAPPMSVQRHNSYTQRSGQSLSLEDPYVRRAVENLATEFRVDASLVMDILAEGDTLDFDQCRARLMILTEG